MKIGIVGAGDRPGRSIRLLLSAASKRGCRAVYMPIRYLAASIEDGTVVITPSVEIDAALVRSLGFAPTLEIFLARISILEALSTKIPVTNSPGSLLKARHKFLTYLTLLKKNIPVPRTILTENVSEGMKAVEKYKSIVIKPPMGARGFGSLMLSNGDLAFQAFSTLRELGKPLLVQEYLEKPGRDIRLFVIGEDVVASMYRYAPSGSWKTNISQGGRGVAMKPEPELEEIAVKSCKALGLEYAGVDVAEVGDEGYVVLEVNGMPGFTGIMDATGVDIPGLLIEYVCEKGS